MAEVMPPPRASVLDTVTNSSLYQKRIQELVDTEARVSKKLTEYSYIANTHRLRALYGPPRKARSAERLSHYFNGSAFSLSLTAWAMAARSTGAVPDDPDGTSGILSASAW